MSYILGNITLPNPKKLERRIIERSVENLLMFGRMTKRTENRKEQFVLTYQFLSQAQINAILALYTQDQVLSFTITDLNIGPTDVLVDVQNLEYPPETKESGEFLANEEDMERARERVEQLLHDPSLAGKQDRKILELAYKGLNAEIGSRKINLDNVS